MTQKNRSQSQKKADRDVVFHPEFREDLRYWVETDRKSTRAKLIQEHPDEKPPRGDGDLFTSLFEGAQSFRLGRPTVLGNRAEVPVHLAYVEGGSTTRSLK